MSSSSKPRLAEQAAELLAAAQNAGLGEDPARLLQEAQVTALLAIAGELADIRGGLDAVKGALEDQDGVGPGWHLRYISDWLEKISDRIGR